MARRHSYDDIKISIADFLMDRTEGREALTLLDEISSDPHSGKIFRELSLTWALASSSHFSLKEDAELRKIHNRIKVGRHRPIPRKFWYGAVGIAASLAIALCLTTVLLVKENRRIASTYSGITSPYEVSVPNGSITTVTLPDGSVATLNSGSRLTYPHDFGIFDRTLSLEGEAFFNVSKDSEKPFSVRAGAISVLVTGTTFNVEAYNDEDKISVSLIEGAVLIKDKFRERAALRPNQQAVYDKATGGMKILNTDPNKAVSWMNGSLSFINVPFKIIAGKLSRRFGVKIIISSKHLEEQHYTGTFHSTMSLDEILREIDVENLYSLHKEDGIITISDKKHP